MKIVILAEAQRQFETQDDWWRDRSDIRRGHRDAKELFVDEFEQTPAAKKTTRSGNTIRGVRKDHPQRKDFDTAATNRFGRAAPYTGNP